MVVEAGVGGDTAALRRILSEWPTPVVLVPRELGDQLMFPGANLDAMFSWAPSHPVVDAYKAFKAMPYDAPLHDVAAMYYAHKTDGPFSLSDPGTLSAGADGKIVFAPGTGTARKLVVDPSKKTEALDALIAMAATQPPPPAQRGRGGD